MKRLDAIKKRVEAATKGPWDAEYGVSLRSAWRIKQGYDSSGRTVVHLNGPDNIALDAEEGEVEENLEFIAHSREDIELLLKVAEAAKLAESAMDDMTATRAMRQMFDGLRDALDLLDAEE